MAPFVLAPAWPNTSRRPSASHIGLPEGVRMLGRGLGGSEREAESTALFFCSHQQALVEPLLWGPQDAKGHVSPSAEWPQLASGPASLALCCEALPQRAAGSHLRVWDSRRNRLTAKPQLRRLPLPCWAPRAVWGLPGPQGPCPGAVLLDPPRPVPASHLGRGCTGAALGVRTAGLPAGSDSRPHPGGLRPRWANRQQMTTDCPVDKKLRVAFLRVRDLCAWGLTY